MRCLVKQWKMRKNITPKQTCLDSTLRNVIFKRWFASIEISPFNNI